MKKILLSFMLLSLFVTYAQQNDSKFQLIGIEEKTNNKSAFNSTFKEYNLYSINTNEIANYLKKDNNTKYINLKLGENFNFPLTLNHHSLRTSNYILQENTENEGIIMHPKSEIFTFRGYNGSPDQKVVLTIAKGFISGYVMSEDKVLYIEPSKKFNKTASKNSFIIYSLEGVKSKDSKAICNQGEKIPEGVTLKKTSKPLVTNCVEMGVAFDQSYKTLMGGTSEAETEITARLNLVSEFYVEKFNIEYKLVTIYECAANEFISDSETESCQEGNGTCQDGTVLKEFSKWGNSAAGFGGIARDVSSFWTDRDLKAGFSSGNIGYSFFRGICGEQGYNIIEDFFTTGINAHVSIWIHELGHTWDAYHVPDNSVNMMSPNIYGNDSSAPTNRTVTNGTLTSITNFRDTLGSCLDAGCAATQAPVSSFTADSVINCGLSTINFTDNSSNNPVSWEWDFGDGNTSTDQNPTNTFSPGQYTVTLTATNDIGVGNTVSQIITVINGVQFPIVNLGPVDNNEIAGGGFYNSAGRYLIFDTNEEVVLSSVKVYARDAGSRTFSLRDSSGQVLETISVQLSGGEERVNLDWTINVGTDYQLFAPANSDLYRNNTPGGANYPYTDSSGLVSIKCQDYEQSNCNNYYYYFYDWEVRKSGCDQNTASVNDNILEEVAIYPNPFNDVLNIKVSKEESYSYKVYGALGNVVFSNNQMISGETKIDLRNLSSGLYFIELKNESSKKQKVIKVLKK